MRKKPDILLLLVVLVVSGVVISNFVVFKHDNRISSLALLNAHYSTFKIDNSASLQLDKNVSNKFRPREVVRIDSSKQQIH